MNSVYGELRCKSPQQNISKSNPPMNKNNLGPYSNEIYSAYTSLGQHWNMNLCNQLYQQTKKNNMILSTNSDIIFDNI